MRMPYMNDLGRTQTIPLLFQGINKQDLIKDTEISDGNNLDSENAPALTPRRSISIVKTITSPNMLTMINNKEVYISGTNFYYDGVLRGQVSTSKKSLVDFNGNIVIFPDKKYYDYIDNTFGEFTCPYNIDYATVHYNRIFGIKGSEVFASKVGDFKIWDDYSGDNMDSWAADVYSPGDFTGITSYQDHVILFKRDQMYELYGYIPSQFKIMESAKIGCVDSRSISEVAGMLFFMSEKGLQTYSGGFPRSISQQLNIDTVTSAVGVGDGRKYYLSINGMTYIYDTWKELYMPYMDKDIISFCKSTSGIFGLTSTGDIIKLEEGNEKVEWEAITKEFDDGTFKKKAIKSIRLKAKMDMGSEISIYVKTDERNFILHKVIRREETNYKYNNEIVATIPLKRASNYQIKIVGKGKSIVYGEREFILGSEK